MHDIKKYTVKELGHRNYNISKIPATGTQLLAIEQAKVKFKMKQQRDIDEQKKAYDKERKIKNNLRKQ